jgi:predicted DNA-binding antitoxin AbrB/MazE fold protein
MIKTIEAVFDGRVFRPEEPIPLEPNTRVQITIDASLPLAEAGLSFLEVARLLNLEGLPDWSANLDDYLYGEAGHEG